MSYIYALLCDYKNYEGDDYNPGLDLYKSLYNADGLRSDWKQTYTAWLDEVCDLNQLPEGEFRRCWIQDQLSSAAGDTELDYSPLELIDRWFEPEEEAGEVCITSSGDMFIVKNKVAVPAEMIEVEEGVYKTVPKQVESDDDADIPLCKCCQEEDASEDHLIYLADDIPEAQCYFCGEPDSIENFYENHLSYFNKTKFCCAEDASANGFKASDSDKAKGQPLKVEG